MQLAVINGIELEYELRGSREPVVLIHWGVSARWAEPLLAESVLAERYRLLRYSTRRERPYRLAPRPCRCLRSRRGARTHSSPRSCPLCSSGRSSKPMRETNDVVVAMTTG
jgi:hypothetical protein